MVTKDALLMVAAALPLAYAMLVVLGAARARRIPRLPSPGPDARFPRLSIVVPARNEEDSLAEAMRSKLASSYPDLELVVVDDRSTDRTGAIADAFAREDARVRVVHLDSLPEGWLGKLHALARGAEAATGELILFSDADVRFAPDLLRRAAGTMEARKLDFITLTPHITRAPLALDAVMTTFLRTLVVIGRIWKMSDPRSPVAVGAGLFNLVRRSMLARSPGFEWLRMEVADDTVFGQMIKRAGGACDVFNGKEDVSLAFYESLDAMKHGLEKNAYAGSSYRLALALVILSALFYFELAPALIAAAAVSGAIAHGALVMVAATAVLIAIGQSIVARWTGRSMLTAVLPFLGSAILLWYSARSIFLAQMRGGIYWRGTFYRLDELRRGSRIQRV